MKPFGSAGLFWERPFGNVPTLGADDDVVAAMAANDGSMLRHMR